MPNWCKNELFVKGSKKELKKFIAKNMGYPVCYPSQIKGGKEKKIHEKRFCFNAMVRTPKKVIKIGYDGGEKISEELMKKAVEDGANVFPIDGYHWNIANWGTKWDIYSDGITKKKIDWRSNNLINLFFETAWNPPFRWFETVVKAFPNLEFEMSYWEPGMYFGGVLIGKKGKAKCREYSADECDNTEFFGFGE